ncbi:hypothetical protein BJY16_005274 [Actinoplanes octamycinicus]|uniref:Uncharacterized protein n=1 Tax=Actinoplanes octamycinicus TaxID=135948 RepID=A0A7W7H0N7_9ACTN|nr:hypothetical protein [Actinoplanes octamycinicus]MBB4741815.1 hypothetical protein [Actinoplanes octamycinicus]GIE57373.1 hypothetical protein Aoc01nite_27750 [Actinoplanes octamycinicus]
MRHDDPSAIDALRRWADSGGHWRLIARSDATVTVALMTCTGEEMERSTWAAGPDLLAFLSGEQSG